ncbi:Putative adhesin [Draconibacterium orientale]|uniref:Putative adhesin n=1 Tax=Draconibacterium orientale TaxID=1168034 RepID=X5DFN8_9BACT|nr:DUF4097 family beta strand repeat-containing protein [Draconibacterium orientale]AHW61748.1 hypothetical protein FH5T_07515 [Draconibacterium orientale]SES89121.1 Putative adhesin [Draconibacterium orientale]
MKTQKSLRLFTLIAVLTTVFAMNSFAKDGQPTITKTFDLNQPGQLNASSSGGGVTVETHNQPKVIIQAFVRKNGNLLSPTDRSLDEVLDDFDIDFSKSGSTITAVVKRRGQMNFWRNNVGISLTIIVPEEMSCDVSSSGGGLKISGVKGTHDFSSSGGGVRLENTSGTTKASSSGGGVKATNHDGDIRLSSSGGGVSVEGAHGSVYARSSGGGVSLEGIHGSADASSSGGGVSVSGEASSVTAKSSGGSVRVNIRNLTDELYLQSSGGGVSAVIHGGEKLGLDLDLRSGKVNIDLHNFTGTSEKDRVKGKMNGGGIPVYAHASGGNVTITYED